MRAQQAKGLIPVRVLPSFKAEARLPAYRRRKSGIGAYGIRHKIGYYI